MELDRTEARVLGALAEKRWTVPDQYPLSLNALLAACNQKSNRDPVLELLEFEVSGCLMGLRQRGLVVVHEQYGGRVPRYGEKLMEELHVSREEMSILTELLLRGPQTAGELYRRCARMAPLTSQQQVEALLRDLAGSHLVRLLPKESGQRYARWAQRLCTDTAAADDDGPSQGEPARAAWSSAEPDVPGPGRVAPPTAAVPAAAPDDGPSVQEELAALRAEVAALRRRVEELEDLVAG